jgi:hypothetical protein
LEALPERTEFGRSCRARRVAGDDGTPAALPCNTVLYDVLVVSNGGGGKRFTTERDATLSVGHTFEQDSESYRVLAIQTGHGPFDYVIEAEWLASSGPSKVEPA